MTIHKHEIAVISTNNLSNAMIKLIWSFDVFLFSICDGPLLVNTEQQNGKYKPYWIFKFLCP